MLKVDKQLKIQVTGPLASGKSTLLRRLLRALKDDANFKIKRTSYEEETIIIERRPNPFPPQQRRY